MFTTHHLRFENVRSAPLSWDTRATPRSLPPSVIGGPCHCHSVSTCSLPPKTCGVHVNKSRRLVRRAVPSKHLAFSLVKRSHAHTAYSNLLLYTSWFQERIKPSVKAGINFFVKNLYIKFNECSRTMASLSFTPPYTPPHMLAVSTRMKKLSSSYLN